MQRTLRERTLPLLLVALTALWGLGVAMTTLIGLDRLDVTLHYLPFLLLWVALAVIVAVAGGRPIERLGRWAYLLVGVLVLVTTLYYVVGRPIQLDLLAGQTTYPAHVTLGAEIILPVLLGGVLAAIYLLVYTAFTDSWQRIGSNAGVGLSLYLLTGLLLWLHSAAAWLAIQAMGGARPGLWVRFVDDVGPHGAFLQVFMWPWYIVVCCG